MGNGSNGWWRDPYEYRNDAIRVTFAVLVLVMLVRYIEPTGRAQDATTCKLLVQNAERYYAVAQQDRDFNLRLQHAAMAVANVQAVRQLFADSVIERATGSDVHAMFQRMESFMNRIDASSERNKTGVRTSAAPKHLPVWP